MFLNQSIDTTHPLKVRRNEKALNRRLFPRPIWMNMRSGDGRSLQSASETAGTRAPANNPRWRRL